MSIFFSFSLLSYEYLNITRWHYAVNIEHRMYCFHTTHAPYNVFITKWIIIGHFAEMYLIDMESNK